MFVPLGVLRVGDHPSADESSLRHGDCDIRVAGDNFGVPVVDFRIPVVATAVVFFVFRGARSGG